MCRTLLHFVDLFPMLARCNNTFGRICSTRLMSVYNENLRPRDCLKHFLPFLWEQLRRHMHHHFDIVLFMCATCAGMMHHALSSWQTTLSTVPAAHGCVDCVITCFKLTSFQRITYFGVVFRLFLPQNARNRMRIA